MKKTFLSSWKISQISALMRFMIWIYVKIATKIHTKIQIGLHSFVNYLTYLFGHEQPVIHIGRQKLWG